MQADNPVTENFLLDHPVDASRVLENLPPQHCVAFFEDIDHQQAARLFHFFMPASGARCLPLMSADLLNDCAQHALADVCRCLPALSADQQQSVMDRLSSRLARQVSSRLRYPGGTVGRHYSQSCPVLPVSLTIGEALNQLEEASYEDGCQLNVVDDEHKLLGSIDLTRLVSANRKSRLGQLLSRQKRPHLLISSLLLDVTDHPGWLNHRLLPVVDRNGVYMGELDYETVRKYGQDVLHPEHNREAFSSLLSLAGVYWLSVSWLLDCLLGASDRDSKKDS
jgi:Mg/Co/Ni transporter MgtE